MDELEKNNIIGEEEEEEGDFLAPLQKNKSDNLPRLRRNSSAERLYFDVVPNKTGRGNPAIILNEEGIAAVEKLASWGGTDGEIADFLGVNRKTLTQRQYNKAKYAAAKERGFSNLCMSLRRKQVKLALAGNVKLLIWLGQNYLGQSTRTNTQIKEDGQAVEKPIKIKIVSAQANSAVIENEEED